MEFLRKVVEDLAKQKIDFGEIAIVTPNRRAGLFFKKYIQANEAIKKPVWLPELYSIQDFISSVTKLDLLDRFSLIFQLYDIYTSCFPHPRAFDTYYQWSNIVLSDFEEIDLYLVDREKLFKHLQDISRIEKTFGDSSPMMQGFTQFAGNLHNLYNSFSQALLEKHQAYYGLALRHLVDPFDLSLFKRWNKIIFTGFYALTKAEKKLIELLIQNKRADVYWDIDNYYFMDKKQEAGYFFRENPILKNTDEAKWISDSLQSTTKRIEIIGTAGRVAQAKVMGYFLKKEEDQENDTAIVLPDESLLFPVLHSIQEAYKHINVTMGYPLKNTSLYHLISSIIDLHSNQEPDPNASFHFRDVNRILLHPYVLPLAESEIREFIQKAKENNWILLKPKEMESFDPRIASIFKPVSSVDSFIVYIKKISRDIINSMKSDIHFSPEIEYIYQFYTSLQRIEDILSEHNITLELKTFWNLIREIIDTTSVPFLGEPLQGLQIMGLLETRTLDFKNVYILSVNEGILPAVKSQNSFIPNDVRKGFGMETWEHRDSIYAYYFYRLIQRAEKVKIFYNTMNDAFGKGEKSRFIDQLLHEYSYKNPQSHLEHKVFNFRSIFKKPQSLSVEKKEEVIEQLKTMWFSPTRMQTYVDCSLKFYLKYILKLDEKEELVESADAMVFGSVIHKVLNNLYHPLKGKLLTESDFENMLGRYKQTVEEVYLEEMGSVNIEKGRNFLYCRIIETLISNYLKNEKPGKTVIETEKRFKKILKFDDFNVNLNGMVDRIEKDNGTIDIIDYKTGIINSLQFNLDEQRSDEVLFKELRKKSQVLQLLFYYYLVADRADAGDDVRFRLGIYSFKEQKEIGKTRYLSEGRNRNYYLNPKGGYSSVLNILKQIFQDMFDSKSPFQQIDDDANCGFCPYVEICGR
jgi:hypothetical protein